MMGKTAALPERRGTMELNARNGPKMTEEQITAYLARIGISSPVPLTLEGLGQTPNGPQTDGAF